VHAAYRLLMATLGRRTAELHQALAAARGDPAFQPEAIAPDEPAAWAAAVSSRVEALACLLRKDLDALAPAGRATAGAFLERVDGLVARLSALGEPVHAVKARLHGDLHLGQVLVVGSDVTFVGFGFEPTGVPEARRAKHSPMKDVASLLLSLDRAASSAILRRAAERPEERPVLTSLVRAWQVDSEAALLTGYREGIGDCPTWPSGPGESERLMALFCIEGALDDVPNDTVSPHGRGAASLGRLVVLMDALIAGEACSFAKAHTADPSGSAAA
jgi:maltose alpha-D-glucosyltransferase/alpha-amylase